MEIVFHRYGSICEPDIMEAFQSLGLTVIEEDAEIYQKSIEPEKRISMLAEAILTHQTSFVFSINYFPYISQVCERLHVLYLCLSVDCPVLELFSETIRNGCNRIFLFDYEQYEQIRGENADNIFYLPLGANVARMVQLLNLLSVFLILCYRKFIFTLLILPPDRKITILYFDTATIQYQIMICAFIYTTFCPLPSKFPRYGWSVVSPMITHL